ncbi:MAG: ROK family protein [Verrucomicrobiota bacterium]
MSKKKRTYEGRVWIGFDLGGTKMLSKVFNDDYQTLGRAKQKTQGAKGSKAGLQRMVSVIEEALEDANVEPEQIAGIGVGCPGPLNLTEGKIVEAPNLGWRDVPIEEYIGEAFDCRAVISNDVDAGIYAEYQEGAARDARCAVGIFPGTGIGAGAVMDGRMVRGAHLSCMELGHIPIFPETSGDGGDTTSLEDECSRLKIATEAARAAFRGRAPNLLKTCGTDLSNITSGKLAAAIEAGDVEIENIVRRAASLLGCGVTTIVHLLSPDVIVLGGGLVEAMPELYLETVRESANDRVLPSYRGSFKIVTAELEDDAGVMGAAAWARKTVEELG